MKKKYERRNGRDGWKELDNPSREKEKSGKRGEEKKKYKGIERNKKGLQQILLEDGQILIIPKLPELGELDLENIKNATYMIT